jgi:hypothetical protein
VGKWLVQEPQGNNDKNRPPKNDEHCQALKKFNMMQNQALFKYL